MSNEDINSVGSEDVVDSAESNQNEEVVAEEGVEDLKAQMPSELEQLKGRATRMGLKFHPSIKAEKLKNKINDFQASSKKEDAKRARQLANENEQEIPAPVDIPLTVNTVSKVETKAEKRIRLHKESARYVRIRIANMNPNKKEWEGEIFTVSNSVVGTFKKYVPFNNEEGWHVPNIIYKMLKEKRCQIFYTVKNDKGAKVRKGKLINEYAIEVLPNLTFEELTDLAQRQAMTHSID